MYGDITKYPFIVFHYPPLYHIVTRLVVSLGLDWLAAGRTVSVVSTFLIVVLSVCLTYSASKEAFGRLASLVGGSIGGLTVLTHSAVVEWSPLMRVDMLALSLSLLGLLLCAWSLERPVWLFGAIFAFVLAIYTKQTELAAPVAAIGPYLVLRPRRLVVPMLCGLVIAAAALTLLLWRTDGRFLQHVILYNINRFDIRRAYWSIRLLLYRNWIFLVVALVGVIITSAVVVFEVGTRKVTGVFSCLRSNRSAWLFVTLLTYLALLTVTLGELGKSGANKNYAVEWLCACSLFVGIALSGALHSATSIKRTAAALLMPLGPIVIATLLIIHVMSVPLPNEAKFRDVEQRRQLAELTRWVRAAPKTVLSDDMVLTVASGKQVPLEPQIFAELSAMGRWDERREVDLITSQSFQFIVTDGERGDYYFDTRYNAPVADAIELVYPIKTTFAGYTIHLPKDNDCELGPPLRCPPDVEGH